MAKTTVIHCGVCGFEVLVMQSPLPRVLHYCCVSCGQVEHWLASDMSPVSARCLACVLAEVP